MAGIGSASKEILVVIPAATKPIKFLLFSDKVTLSHDFCPI